MRNVIEKPMYEMYFFWALSRGSAFCLSEQIQYHLHIHILIEIVTMNKFNNVHN